MARACTSSKRQIETLRYNDRQKYVAINLDTRKEDMGDVANEMDAMGYDFVCVVQQVAQLMITMMFKRVDSQEGS